MLERWSNGPHAAYAPHDHPYHKTLKVLRGSITFLFETTGRNVELRSGDSLEIPPHTPHSAVVGPEGVECTEEHR